LIVEFVLLDIMIVGRFTVILTILCSNFLNVVLARLARPADVLSFCSVCHLKLS
jgi:hypothetical protein